MSKRGKRGAKQRGGTFDVNTKANSVIGKRAVAVGAIVNGPGAGNQKVRTKIDKLVGDDDALLLGAVFDGRTRKKS